MNDNFFFFLLFFTFSTIFDFHTKTVHYNLECVVLRFIKLLVLT